MNCFDCRQRVEGVFPAKWECSGKHHIDPPLGLNIEFMKVGCRSHWEGKPKPSDEDFQAFYNEYEKAKVWEQKKLIEEFKRKFQLKPHVSKKKARQLSLL
jgi:hypothetical protein